MPVKLTGYDNRMMLCQCRQAALEYAAAETTSATGLGGLGIRLTGTASRSQAGRGPEPCSGQGSSLSTVTADTYDDSESSEGERKPPLSDPKTDSLDPPVKQGKFWLGSQRHAYHGQ